MVTSFEMDASIFVLKSNIKRIREDLRLSVYCAVFSAVKNKES